MTGLVLAVGILAGRPSIEPLYSGLARDDVVAIGSTLREIGIPFDVNADGTVVYVPLGQAPFARMRLTEKGLPRSGNVGNELFDKVGSLGLTSFMQDVTRTRAMEGELARTIMMMRGVRAARVHLVMGDPGSFRRERQSPSASVVVRIDGPDGAQAGLSIRRLVASAVPGMASGAVTVLNSDGSTLAVGDELSEQNAGSMRSLEAEMSRQVRDNVARTLAPYLNSRNFQVGATVRLNVDKRQIVETTFNPESKVERSVRVVKENQTSQNSSTQPPTSVQSNLPQSKTGGADARQANDESQRRDETTNYELSSKQVTTTSSGYVVDALSVVVLVNKSALQVAKDGRGPARDAEEQLNEIQEIVATAVGARKDRGDVVKVSVVDFLDPVSEDERSSDEKIPELIAKQAGPITTAAAFVFVSILFIIFAIRPLVNALGKSAATDLGTPRPDTLALSDETKRGANEYESADSIAIDAESSTEHGARNGWRDIAADIEALFERDESRVISQVKEWLSREAVS